MRSGNGRRCISKDSKLLMSAILCFRIRTGHCAAIQDSGGMMLERGVNPRVVQEFLGHKDISTTLGIYTGVTSDVMKQAAEGADEAMRGMMR